MPTVLPGRSIVTGCIWCGCEGSEVSSPRLAGGNTESAPRAAVCHERAEPQLPPSRLTARLFPQPPSLGTRRASSTRPASHEPGGQSTLCQGLRRPTLGPAPVGNAARPLSAGSLPRARHRHPGPLSRPASGLVRCDPTVGFIQHGGLALAIPGSPLASSPGSRPPPPEHPPPLRREDTPPPASSPL